MEPVPTPEERARIQAEQDERRRREAEEQAEIDREARTLATTEALASLRAVPEEEPLDLSWTMPIDFGVLANLPRQGSRLGYHVLGATVKTVLKKLNDGLEPEARMTSGYVGQRITRWLLPKGLVVAVKVHGAGSSKAYQITPEGERVLEQGRKEGLT
jgi:hypothetical protein